MNVTLPLDEVHRLIQTDHHDPFSILGLHEIEIASQRKQVVRAFFPDAIQAFIISPKDPQNEYPMKNIHEAGFFEAVFEPEIIAHPYQLKSIYKKGDIHVNYDPYAFSTIISDYDLFLFGKGEHQKIYEKLGAHICQIDGVKGVHFALWAPNAKRVSLVGDFNLWDGRRHQMRCLMNSGVWYIFIPNLDEKSPYKFELKIQDSLLRTKSDPYAFYSELRPKTASLVVNIDRYNWSDQKWMAERSRKNPLTSPVSIYEVHLGSWMRASQENNRCLNYRELAYKLVDYVKDMGYTHIELLPISEHPLDESWGYQVSGYYSLTSRYGSPEDFMFFIDQCHQNRIGVILDWVPAHFPKDDHALRWFDGTFLYEHQDARLGEHPDWGTLIFNYGRNEVKNFLISNALFWFEKYHIDGLRIDAVASMLYLDYSRKEGEWIPNQYGGKENLEAIDFLKKLNEIVYANYPGVLMVAEESTAWPQVTAPTYLGGLGFGFKWNMGWMNDTLEYMSKDPIHKKYHMNLLTFSLIYAFSENFILPLSHDEVVHGKRSLLDKMPGDMWQKFANLRLLYGFMFGHPGKKLLFMSGDFGQWDEWNHAKSLDWHLLEYDTHRGIQQFIKDLNQLYKSQPALYENDFHRSGFEWIDLQDLDNSAIAFLRRGKRSEETLIFVCNFTPVVRENYRIGVPHPGYYTEMLNSDSKLYGGSGAGNLGGVAAENRPWHNHPCSLNLVLPPLAVLVFKPNAN